MADVVTLSVIALSGSAALTALIRVSWVAYRTRRDKSRERERKAREEALAAAHHLVASARRSADSSVLAPVHEAALVLSIDSVAAHNLACSTTDLMPALLTVGEEESTDQVLGSLERVFQTLNRNAVAVAGAEQALCGAIALHVTGPEALAVTIQHLGNILPEHLHAAGADIFAYLHSAGFSESVHDVALPALTGIAKSILSNTPDIADALAAHSAAPLAEVVGKAVLSGGKSAFFDLAKDALTSPEIHDATAELTQLATSVGESLGDLGLADGAAAHIPVITIALSSIREYKLLAAEKTDIATASKHVALDGAGTGIGGAIGGAVGSVLFPGAGTVIGAAIGGATGRAVSGRIKRKPLREATANFEQLSIDCPTRIRSFAGALHQSIAIRAEKERVGFLNEIGTSPRVDRSEAATLSRIACELSQAITQQVVWARQVAMRARQYATHLDQPTIEGLRLAESMLNRSETCVRESNDLIQRGALVDALAAITSAPIPDATQCPSGEHLQFVCNESAEHLAALADAYRLSVAAWNRQAFASFTERSQVLGDFASVQLSEYQVDRDSALAEVETAHERVKREREKLGK